MKQLRLIISILFLSFTQTISAQGISEFTQKGFEEAQKANQIILLDFHADWCSTCLKQKINLEILGKEKKLEAIIIFNVNFDKSVELKKTYNVQKQSTFILFKGNKEMGRVAGVTDLDQTRSFLIQGL